MTMSGSGANLDSDRRLGALLDWLELIGHRPDRVLPASGDASFRRYFRVYSGNETFIAMDAPPDREDCYPFVTIDDLLAGNQVHVPAILAQDLTAGFLLLEDFGDRQYLQALDEANADALYADALDSLFHLHQQVPHNLLPRYDDKLLYNEMQLFVDWYLVHHLGCKLNHRQLDVWAGITQLLAENALEQPRVFVHRDFHSRNLMVTTERNPGVLDFQDAVAGPITYDLVSLLRDCYIRWPQERVATWAADYHARLIQHGLCEAPLETFARWFDLMGMQRHLKAIGIFARLKHRDGKDNYLQDIPRTYQYIADLYPHYPELAKFAQMMAELDIVGSHAAKSS
jgi:hypothetical protein